MVNSLTNYQSHGLSIIADDNLTRCFFPKDMIFFDKAFDVTFHIGCFL